MNGWFKGASVLILAFAAVVVFASDSFSIWTSNDSAATTTNPIYIPDAKFTIDENGYVGIGTLSPTSSLEVAWDFFGNEKGLTLGAWPSNANVSTMYFKTKPLATDMPNFASAGGTDVLIRSGTDIGTITLSVGTTSIATGINVRPGFGTPKKFNYIGIGTDIPSEKLYVNGNIYSTANVSALSFTDRTPYFDGDALAALKPVSGKDSMIDHSTLPAFARSIRKWQEPVYDPKCLEEKKPDDSDEKCIMDWEEKQEEQRDLGAMISIQTKAIQQLLQRIEILESLVNK